MGYFDDFLDMGDTQPIKVDDLPDAFESLAELSGLPPDIAGNAITSALKGQKKQNTSTTPLTSALANLDPNDPSTARALSNMDLPFDLINQLPGLPTTMDFAQKYGFDIPSNISNLDPVRERTRELELLALLDPNQFNPTLPPVNPPMYDPIVPPPLVPLDPLTAPQYAGSYQAPALTLEEQIQQDLAAISDGSAPAPAGAGGILSDVVGGFYDWLTGDNQIVTTKTGQTQSVDRDLVFKPDVTGDYQEGGIFGDYVTPEEFAKDPEAEEKARSAYLASRFAQGQSQAFSTAAPNVNIPFGGNQRMGGYNLIGLLDQRPQSIISSQVPPISTRGGIDEGADRFAGIDTPTGLQGRDRTIGTTGRTADSRGRLDEGVEPVEPKPVDVDSDDAEAIIAQPELLTVESRVNNKNKTGTEGRTEAFDRDGNLIPEGQSKIGQSLYTFHNGSWKYRGESGNITETDEQFFARLDDQTEDVPSAQPSAPGAPSQFPIAPSFQPTINQFGQPVVQATGQPMQQVMRAPTTYGEVLGGTPMQPMTTTGGFYDDLYQQSLSPVDAFKAYQLSQFPGASLGSRLAAQDALGTGFDPAFGRFLLGSASGRIAPTFETVDGSDGFGRYLRDRQRADLSQVRQEFANLGAALRGYTPGGTLDPRFASYYETFGDPSDPSTLRNSVLRAAQAALGTRERTGALGNIYDVMQQQYGTGAGSRFADFVGGAFSQQPMMQSFAQNMSSTVPVRSASYSLAPPTLPGLPAYDPYNPINRLGATTAASARVAPLVTPNYQPMSGFGTPLTNQQYADIY